MNYQEFLKKYNLIETHKKSGDLFRGSKLDYDLTFIHTPIKDVTSRHAIKVGDILIYDHMLNSLNIQTNITGNDINTTFPYGVDFSDALSSRRSLIGRISGTRSGASARRSHGDLKELELKLIKHFQKQPLNIN